MVSLAFLIILIVQVNFSISQSCGKFQFNSGLVVNGDTTVRGEFPFLVALLKLATQNFFCASTLVSQKHSITAAHCIFEKFTSNPIQAEDIVALLGRYNLKHTYERGSSSMEINKIIIHNDWKPYVKRYDADIAILVFEREVQYNDFIKPACILGSFMANSLKAGKVVGWGASEKTDFQKSEDIPRKTDIKAPPSNEYCFLHQKDLTELSSNRTFCAGGENSGPCRGDSGGGFFVTIDSTWYLQGIVSSSLLNQNLECDVKNYAVYTNVALYSSWIWENINELEPTALNCKFYTSSTYDEYACAPDITITKDNNLITSAIGSHEKGKSNKDVTLFSLSGKNKPIVRKEIHFIPSGISDVFPSLTILFIQQCKLTKLSRKNFKRMNFLEVISLTNNFIEHIDEDTFYEVPKLYSLRINGNKLKSIPYNMLAHSNQFEHFEFSSNFLETLDGEIFRNCPQLNTIYLNSNALTKISINLSYFKKLTEIFLSNNICINSSFDSTQSTTTLQSFQELIDKNC